MTLTPQNCWTVSYEMVVVCSGNTNLLHKHEKARRHGGTTIAADGEKLEGFAERAALRMGIEFLLNHEASFNVVEIAHGLQLSVAETAE